MDFDQYTVQEIRLMIAQGVVREDDVIHFYNSEWWDQVP